MRQPTGHALRDPLQSAADLNAVARFLARPDIEDLTPRAVASAVGRQQADLLVLLGNSVLFTVDRAAEAFKQGVAAEMLVAGGRGHSTDYLRAAVRQDPRYTGCEAERDTEAEIIRELLMRWHHLDERHVTVETKSTNCGSNAAEVYRLLGGDYRSPADVLLVQDPTMQMRSHASFLRVWRATPETRFFSCPAFIPVVQAEGDGLLFAGDGIAGMWDMERFLSLVMGEIPRLRDDSEGYGPCGRGFIAHVEIPGEVEAAYARLLHDFGRYVRPKSAR